MNNRHLAFKDMIGNVSHVLRVDHWTEWLEGCPDSTKHILRVFVEYINVWGHATRINSEAWIDDMVLSSGILYRELEAWKGEHVPQLTAKVLKLLYSETREGNVA